ncbi:hypothetical protein KVA01_00210 [Kocuria varians]|uniref:LysR substrate-binding domain-containing protein n=2 Tax=Kocuria varians TaxID=1272 RepID=A0A4Y4CZX4_KOCVA|nr:hypothetical protein KVA01_00210 [Kocuria varians]
MATAQPVCGSLRRGIYSGGMTAAEPTSPLSEPAPESAAPDDVTAPEDTAPEVTTPAAAGEDEQEADGTPAEDSLTIGYVPGVMPGKWFGRWRERRMKPVLRDALVPAAGWREALDGGEVTACFVRLGWDPAGPSLESLRTTHHAVPLYDELRVAVLSTDDVLGVLDTLTLAQLTEEATPQAHADIDDAAMAVELAAAGVGPVVLPMSVARLHARKDVTTREITDAPTVPVALVWPRGLEDAVEDAVQRFVGVVRGRKESSGRGSGADSRGNDAAASRQGEATVSRRDGSGRTAKNGDRTRAGRPERASSSSEIANGTGTGAAPAEATAATPKGKGQSSGWAKAGASTKPGLRRKPGRKVKNGRAKKRR